MIKDIQEGEWTVAKTGRKYICKIATRVCDGCGIAEICRLTVIKANRRERKEEKDYCYNCAQKRRILPTGPAFRLWKHGKTYNGYNRITVNKKRILEHVHVMQEFLKRQLQGGETTHHIDMNKSNNSIPNLYLFKSQADHQKCHITMENCGFKLFGKLIWFDRNGKKYVTFKTESPIFENVDIPKTGKLHKVLSYGRQYWFYNEKNSSGVWTHKRYHILLAEAVIKRLLFKNECVHHVDGDTLNNSLDNLCVVTKEEHGQAHTSLQQVVAKLYETGVVGFLEGTYYIKGENENLALSV